MYARLKLPNFCFWRDNERINHVSRFVRDGRI